MGSHELHNQGNHPPSSAARRDDWSEGAVACLLDTYESTWEPPNRAKLKGRSWEDVARRVSGRAGGARTAKTPAQCKNKIESMKKRYRSESAAAAAGRGGGEGARGGTSRWPFFGRFQRLMSLRNDTVGDPGVERSPEADVVPARSATAGKIGAGAAKEPSESKENKEQSQTQIEEKQGMEAIRDLNEIKKKKKKRKMEEEDGGFDMTRSIHHLAEAVLKVEQLRMEATREVEKIRARAEAKKGELDLKRTELLANTQLKIARLLYKSNG